MHLLFSDVVFFLRLIFAHRFLRIEESESHQQQINGQYGPENGGMEIKIGAQDGDAHHARQDGKPWTDEVWPEIEAQHTEKDTQNLHAQPQHMDGEAGHKAVLLRSG